MTLIKAERLKELLTYNSETGQFYWKHGAVEARYMGKPISQLQNGRYVRIQIEGKMYLAHRLAWLYTYGAWPSTEIDHIDRNTKNNAIANLREVSHTENLRNSQYSNNKTGYKGVMFEERRGLYKAQISIGGRAKFLGYFQTAEEASRAYQKKLNEISLEGTL